MLVNIHTITHTSVYMYINASIKVYMPTPTLRISVRVRASLAIVCATQRIHESCLPPMASAHGGSSFTPH